MDEIYDFIQAQQRVSRGADQSLLRIPSEKYQTLPERPQLAELQAYLKVLRDARSGATHGAFSHAYQREVAARHGVELPSARPGGFYSSFLRDYPAARQDSWSAQNTWKAQGSYREQGYYSVQSTWKAQQERSAQVVYTFYSAYDQPPKAPDDDFKVVRSAASRKASAQHFPTAVQPYSAYQPFFAPYALATQAEVEALDNQLITQLAPFYSADLAAELASQQLIAEKLSFEKQLLQNNAERQSQLLLYTQEENRFLREENAQLLADLEQAHYMASELSARVQKAGLQFQAATASVMESATVEALQSYLAAYQQQIAVFEREREKIYQNSRQQIADAINALDREKEEFLAYYHSLAYSHAECRDCAASRERIRTLELQLASKDAQIGAYEELLQQYMAGKDVIDQYSEGYYFAVNYHYGTLKDAGLAAAVLPLIRSSTARQEALDLMAQDQFGFLYLRSGEIWRFLDASGPCSRELHFYDRQLALGAGAPQGVLCCIKTPATLDFVDLSEMQLTHVFLSTRALQIDLTGNDLYVADVSRCGRCTVSVEKAQKTKVLPSPECVVSCV